MRYRRLYKAAAVLTAMSMIAVTPMTVLAATKESVAIEGSGSEEADAVSNDKSKTGVSMSDKTEGKWSDKKVTESLDGNVTVKGDVTVTNKDTTGKNYFIEQYGEDKWNERIDTFKQKYEKDFEDQRKYYDTTGVEINSKDGSATLNIGGDVTADTTQGKAYQNTYGIYSTAKSGITVGGDVTAKANDGTALSVYSDGDGSTIVIGGSVNASSESFASRAVILEGDTKLTVVGDVKASTNAEATTTTLYDEPWENYAEGVFVGDGTSAGELNIGGNVEASGINAIGIEAGSGSTSSKGNEIKITVGGDVNATATNDGMGTGIFINQNDKKLDITVEGDITGTTYGIYSDRNAQEAKIVTDGTLSSKDNAAIVVITDGENKQAPDITVWKIESGKESIVAAYTKGTEEDYEAVPSGSLDGLKEDTDYAKEVSKSINYIIKADEVDNGKIVLKGTSGTATVGDKTYETAHQGEEITINVETAKGYKCAALKNGEALLTANEDGSYTLTIPEGGGVDLQAVLEKIGRSSSGGSSSSSGSGSSVSSFYSNKWTQDSSGWRFVKLNGSYAAGEWIKAEWNSKTDWYHFNTAGYADGGWFTDADGQKYYLYNVHDGRYGYMLTGWNQIDGVWYYFNTFASNGASLGSLVTGGTTPDGYAVDASGAWIK